MDNGQDLVAMCCTAYESPDIPQDEEEEKEQELVDYCEYITVHGRLGMGWPLKQLVCVCVCTRHEAASFRRKEVHHAASPQFYKQRHGTL